MNRSTFESGRIEGIFMFGSASVFFFSGKRSGNAEWKLTEGGGLVGTWE